MRSFAVIPTHNRPVELRRCVDSIVDQVDRVIVIDNASSPPVERSDDYVLLTNSTQPPNLSKLWNKGLDYVERGVGYWETDVWDVAILNDDAIVPPGWFRAMSTAMSLTGAVAASQEPFGGRSAGAPVTLYGPGDQPSVATRLTGWAFVLRGESGLRFDERLRWWCGDDLMSLEARRNGGLVHVPGFPVANTRANESTVGELAEQAARDMEMFVQITGVRPW